MHIKFLLGSPRGGGFKPPKPPPPPRRSATAPPPPPPPPPGSKLCKLCADRSCLIIWTRQPDALSGPVKYSQYAVKVQRSLAPLSRFRGSHIPSAHEQECCRFQSYANSVRSPMKFTREIDIAWTTFLGSTTTDHVITSCDVGFY